jgi:hypothetical protein
MGVMILIKKWVCTSLSFSSKTKRGKKTIKRGFLTYETGCQDQRSILDKTRKKKAKAEKLI